MRGSVFFLMPALMLCIGAAAADAPVRMPEGFILRDAPGCGTWRQWGEMTLAYAAARKRVDLVLRQQGWRKAKSVEIDRVRWKSLEVWSRGRQRIMVQYWRQSVDVTGVAWGGLTEEDKS